MNDDGPSLKLKAGFSVSLAEPHGAFYQNDAMDNQSEGSCCTGMNSCQLDFINSQLIEESIDLAMLEANP